MQSEVFPYSTTGQTPLWWIAEPLDPAIRTQIAAFNRIGLQMQREALGELNDPAAESGGLPPAITELCETWRALDDAALSRLSAMPYLLFEMGFQELRPEVPARPSPATIADARREFARSLLNYAWYLARANPLGAAVGLGMPAASAAALRELSFSDQEMYVPRIAACLSLRWADRPTVWRGMLAAATSGNDRALQLERVSGLRRLAGELLPVSSQRVLRTRTAATTGRQETRSDQPLW